MKTRIKMRIKLKIKKRVKLKIKPMNNKIRTSKKIKIIMSKKSNCMFSLMNNIILKIFNLTNSIMIQKTVTIQTNRSSMTKNKSPAFYSTNLMDLLPTTNT